MTTPASLPDVTVLHADQPVAESLDRLSLEQALRDVEVANARVVDLTARLTTSHAELRELRTQVAELQRRGASGLSLAGVRQRAVGPVKAVARAVLPLSLRTWLRAQLR